MKNPKSEEVERAKKKKKVFEKRIKNKVGRREWVSERCIKFRREYKMKPEERRKNLKGEEYECRNRVS